MSQPGSRAKVEECSRSKELKRGKVAQSTRKVFSLDAFESRPHDLLISKMDEVLKSEEENVVIACGVNNKKATLITLRFETKEEFSKVLGILEKYAKPKNAEMGSLSQEKVSEVKSKFKEHFEMGSKKTGNVPPELRTSVSVANPYFTSRNPNPDSPSISQSSSVQDSSSITVITLTNGESTPSYTNGMITLPRKNSASEDDNRFDGNSLKGFPIFSKRGNARQSVTPKPPSKNLFNPLPPVKIVRRAEKTPCQGILHRQLSLTSECSTEAKSPRPRLMRSPTRRSGYQPIPVRRLHSGAQSCSSSDSSSGYSETRCSSSRDSPTVKFYKGVEFIVPQCPHRHFTSTVDNVWVYNEPVGCQKSIITSYPLKPWLCFH
uniref:Expressed conserved protein n=1 Tax=Echinococcus granulosus TaxID=6210 RepID=A0A068WBX9_ECHGR|nr:expressed conserved protein [Echinococcus granulosus]